jgi:hypothetical protein
MRAQFQFISLFPEGFDGSYLRIAKCFVSQEPVHSENIRVKCRKYEGKRSKRMRFQGESH